MDNRRDKDKKFDRAQAMDRLTQDDKDKISLIKMMLDKEKKSMKEVDEAEKMDGVDSPLANKFAAVAKAAGVKDAVTGKEEMKEGHSLDQGEMALLRSLRSQIDQGVLNSKQKTAFVKLLDSLIDTNISERRAVSADKKMDKAIDKDEKFRDMKKENIDYRLDPYDDKEEVEGMIIKLIVGKRGVDADIAKSFIDTHYTDIINADGPDGILDEFDEFMSVNTEYVREEDNVEFDVSDAAAGDSAIERESASGAFEESKNWRGETLKEQFKRLTK